jgi:hypothetical protein
MTNASDPKLSFKTVILVARSGHANQYFNGGLLCRKQYNTTEVWICGASSFCTAGRGSAK